MDANFFATMYKAVKNTNATGTPLMVPIITAATLNQNPSTSNSAAIMNTNATGTSQALPVLPPATLDRNTSTSNSATPNRKSDKEKERREKTNQLFEELFDLIRKQGDGNMSQAKILTAALKAAKNHKREFQSDPQSRGLFDSLEKVKQLTIQQLGSLNLPHPANYTSLQNLEKIFEDFLDVVLPVTPSTHVPVDSSTPSSSDAPESDDVEKTRKEKRKNREQNRRNHLDEGFELLRQFIAKNNLVKSGDQKIQVLETIIAFLRSKPTLQPSQTAAAQYDTGFIQGRHSSQNLAQEFFENDIHLSYHATALQNYIASQIGPLNSPTHMANFRFDNTAITNFRSLHPGMIGFNGPMTPSPTALEAPVPITAPVAVPAAVTNPSPVSQPVSRPLWRPWE
ncbi:unnamed protein product [Caenorhabditis brenneri]